ESPLSPKFVARGAGKDCANGRAPPREVIRQSGPSGFGGAIQREGSKAERRQDPCSIWAERNCPHVKEADLRIPPGHGGTGSQRPCGGELLGILSRSAASRWRSVCGCSSRAPLRGNRPSCSSPLRFLSLAPWPASGQARRRQS